MATLEDGTLCILPGQRVEEVGNGFAARKKLLAAGFATVLAALGATCVFALSSADFTSDIPDALDGDAPKGTCEDEMQLTTDNGLCYGLDSHEPVLVPTAMLLGSQKCATSSLSYHMLSEFPSLRYCGKSPDTTERHFFDTDHPKGLWYNKWNENASHKDRLDIKPANCGQYYHNCYTKSSVSIPGGTPYDEAHRGSWVNKNSCNPHGDFKPRIAQQALLKFYSVHDPSMTDKMIGHILWTEYDGKHKQLAKALLEKYGATVELEAPGVSIGLEYTPNYFQEYAPPERIRRMYGSYSQNIRFIQVFRDPVDRVHSYFTHFMPESNFNTWAKRTLASLKTGYPSGCWGVQLPYDDDHTDRALGKGITALCASAYVVHLKHWAASFDKNQFLLLSFTKYLEQPGRTLAAVGQHLGIASEKDQQNLIDNVKTPYETNTAESHEDERPNNFDDAISDEVREQLNAFFAPYNTELFKLVTKRSSGSEEDDFKVAFTQWAGEGAEQPDARVPVLF
jgi:hypothetical protein